MHTHAHVHTHTLKLSLKCTIFVCLCARLYMYVPEEVLDLLELVLASVSLAYTGAKS